MEILQIESVVPNLVDDIPMKRALTYLELQNENAPTGKNNSINPTADAWYIKLQTQKPIDSLKSFLQ